MYFIACCCYTLTVYHWRCCINRYLAAYSTVCITDIIRCLICKHIYTVCKSSGCYCLFIFSGSGIIWNRFVRYTSITNFYTVRVRSASVCISYCKYYADAFSGLYEQVGCFSAYSRHCYVSADFLYRSVCT